MHAATPHLTNQECNYIWEHEVFADCCHSNTAIYIFSIYFFQKSEKNGKNISFNLGFTDNFFLSSVSNYYV